MANDRGDCGTSEFELDVKNVHTVRGDGRSTVMAMKRGMSLLVFAAFVVAIPAALLVWRRVQTEDRLSDLEPDPVVVPVESRQINDTIAVSVVGLWGESLSVVAPLWPGMIASVEVERNADVASSFP